MRRRNRGAGGEQQAFAVHAFVHGQEVSHPLPQQGPLEQDPQEGLLPIGAERGLPIRRRFAEAAKVAGDMTRLRCWQIADEEKTNHQSPAGTPLARFWEEVFEKFRPADTPLPE